MAGIRNEVPTTYGRKKGFPDLKRYQTLETGFKYIGEMSEWSMVQSWKGKKISETYVSGDSKRGPNHLWEEKGTEGGPVGVP